MCAGSLQVKRFMSGHAVFDAHDKRLTGILTHSVAWDRAMDLHRMSKWKTRSCMKCRDDFMSEGAHNRLCTMCNQQNAHMIPECSTNGAL